MINKDVTHPKMRRYIENPRIILLDCPLEYKKGESQTNIEILGEQVRSDLLWLVCVWDRSDWVTPRLNFHSGLDVARIYIILLFGLKLMLMATLLIIYLCIDYIF